MVIREVETWRHLRHVNIAQLYEVIVTEHKIYMVTEYASGGEIFDYIVAQGRVKEKEGKNIFRQLVDAIGYCHDKKFVHRWVPKAACNVISFSKN
jgi:serine/threonine protein kinase